VPINHQNLKEVRIMRRTNGGSKWVGLVAILGLTLTGCAPQATTDTATTTVPPMAADDLEHVHGEGDHGHAHNFAEAVPLIESFRDQIRDGFAKGDASTADIAVHSIGHTLEDMPEFIKQTTLSEEDKVAAGVAVESLLESYGQIDEKIHSNQEVKYDDYAGDIDAAIETLKKYMESAK
jgi:Spy/CpxP family protein refolding chaperone